MNHATNRIAVELIGNAPRVHSKPDVATKFILVTPIICTAIHKYSSK